MFHYRMIGKGRSGVSGAVDRLLARVRELLGRPDDRRAEASLSTMLAYDFECESINVPETVLQSNPLGVEAEDRVEA
jgi:hypothetical protein